MESKISLSQIRLSSTEGWGPDPTFVFEQYKSLPFAPFNKLEKISKFCDVSSLAASKAADADAEDVFHTIEHGGGPKTKTQQYQPRRIAIQSRQQVRTQPTQANNKVTKMPVNKNYRPHYPRNQATRTKFKDTTGIQSDWNYIIDAAKANFDKMPVTNVKVTELGTAGKIPQYDRTWDNRASLKKSPAFTLPNTISLGTGPRSDKFMLDIIEKERDTNELTVYTTDAILSALLTVKYSVFPWDISVVKDGNQIFLEPSDTKKANYIDILTVNENTSHDLPEDEKDMLKLCIESTNVNKKFIELTTKNTEIKDFTAEKSVSIEVPEKKVYRYRKWTLDNKINIVVRSEVDAYAKEGENTPFVKICALNECNSQQDWKQNHELSKGALISLELRNNIAKVGKWLCQALLADCSTFKIGFITKPNPKESKHQVLMVEDMTAKTLASTINFRINDSWSIVKTLADIMSRQDDGVFSFVKAAYKQSIKIYQIPDKEEQME